MDPFSRAYYELTYKVAFLEKRGEAFQDFFATIMEKRFPADFQRTRPWGRVGDRKNDGYLRSKRTLFQVYAPNELSSAETIAKVDEDFHGALPHWQPYFDRWIFAHNASNGLGPEVLAKLLELDAAHADIDIEHWGFEELRRVVFELADADVRSLFGSAPTQRGMLDLKMAELAPLLEHVSRMRRPADVDLRPVPADKLKINALSEHVEQLLRLGMAREQLVRDYFRSRPDPRHRDEVAETFRDQYAVLRADRSLGPDDVFVALQRWVGGDQVGAAHHQEAVFAVLAYMFQECEIFERAAPAGVA